VTERPTFEEALRKLESVVRKLEDPEVSLEESLSLYESGIKLSKFCTQTLEEASLRIERINEGPGNDSAHPDGNGL